MELDKNFGHSEKLHPSTFDSATFYSRPITEQKNETEKAQLPPPFSLKLKSPSSYISKTSGKMLQFGGEIIEIERVSSKF